MLTTVCGWLGAAIGGLLGLVVGLLWSTFHAFADGSRAACVATGGCDANMDERQLENLMIITVMAYFLCFIVGIPLLVGRTCCWLEEDRAARRRQRAAAGRPE